MSWTTPRDENFSSFAISILSYVNGQHSNNNHTDPENRKKASPFLNNSGNNNKVLFLLKFFFLFNIFRVFFSLLKMRKFYFQNAHNVNSREKEKIYEN